MSFAITLSEVLLLQKSQVFVVGDILLDVYVMGKVARISPEAPVPVLLETERRWVAGGAANVSANIAKFGATAYLCGRIGYDSSGDKIKSICYDLGIDTSYLLQSQVVPTITKTRILAGYQQIVRVDSEVCSFISESEQQLICKYFNDFLSKTGNKALIVSDYAKGMLPRELVKNLINMAKNAGIVIVSDPKSLDIERYKGSTVIKPNLKDGYDILRTFMPEYAQKGEFELDVQTMSQCFLKQAAVENVVLSLSEKGIFVQGLLQPEPIFLQSQALKVADVSGAGDTMVAFLAMALSANLSLLNAAYIASLAAGIVCGKTGTETVTVAEMRDELHARHVLSPSCDSLNEIISLLHSEAAIGKRIVFTNGCFDILHAGHVLLLQQSKALGDVLVVGINSDDSIRRLKGPTRPIQGATDRTDILAALSCVDYVLEFSEDTPLQLINKIKPQVLVKGGDYSLNDIVGAAEVLSWGGSVEIIPLLEGRSTTNIVNKSNMGA